MSKPSNPVEKFFIRYNFVVLVVLGATVLSVSIFLSYMTYLEVSNPSEENIKSSIPTEFDKHTQDRIDKLHRSDDPNISVKLPPGRINPFSE